VFHKKSFAGYTNEGLLFEDIWVKRTLYLCIFLLGILPLTAVLLSFCVLRLAFRKGCNPIHRLPYGTTAKIGKILPLSTFTPNASQKGMRWAQNF
jgi:hypothetical protein